MSFECVLVFVNLIHPYSIDIAGVLDYIELQASWFVVLGMTSVLFYACYELVLEPFLDLDRDIDDVHWTSYSELIIMTNGGFTYAEIHAIYIFD
jgi:hypothetical protein